MLRGRGFGSGFKASPRSFPYSHNLNFKGVSHMSTSPNGADIIIKGGSVEIEFNEQTFSGKGGKYSNKDKSIASVEITDQNSNKTQTRHASR